MVQYAIEDGESLQASVANARLLASHGYGVQDGCAVTINTGTLGSGEAALSIASGTLLVDGNTASVSSGTVDIAVGDDQPRKDLVVYDPSADSGAGAFAVVEGTPEAPDPPGASGIDAKRPAPPTLVSSVNALSGSGDPLIPLGEVWVGATTTGITSEDLTNRRVHADFGFGGLSIGDNIDFTATGDPDGALDLRPNSDGSHYLWMMDSGGSSPVEYGAQLNPGGGNAYILRDVTNSQNLFYVDTNGDAHFPAGNLTASSIESDDVNNVLYAAPGEIQSQIDALASADVEGTVKLRPQQTYDPGAEIHVKPGVTLDFNSAVMDISGDHNVLFLDGRCEVKDIAITVSNTSFSSSVILLSTARAGKYGHMAGTEVKAEGHIEGPGPGNGSGIGIHLLDDNTSGSNGIGMGNRFRVDIESIPTAVKADTGSDGWINAARFRGDYTHCKRYVHHIGSGNGAFTSTFNCDAQVTNGTVTAFENGTTADSFLWRGQVWDVNNHIDTTNGEYAIVGGGMTFVSEHAVSMREETDGGASMGYQFHPDMIRYVDYATSAHYRLDFHQSSNEVVFSRPGNVIWRATADGLSTPVRNGYAVNAGEFSSIQAAVDFANNNGYMRVEIPPGTYSETVTPFDGLALVGAGAVKQAPIIDGGASPAIDATGLSNVLVRNLRVQSNNGGTANAFVTGSDARVENVWVNSAGNHGIYCDDVFTSVTGVRTIDANIGGDPIHLGSNSLRCAVTNNLQTTIVNNGSSNVVSNNT